MTASKEIRLFGDLWLPDPGNALPKDELAIVRKLLPLIQRFEEDWYRMAEVPDSKPTNGHIAMRAFWV